MKQITVAITGHRIEKITYPDWVKETLTDCIHDLDTTHLIQGMANGVDLWSARIAYGSKIPYTCARPWKGHSPREEDASDYQLALQHADRVFNVTSYDNFPGAWCYQKRNEWMVDNADLVLAVWDGSRSGTKNCVDYALRKNIAVKRLNPETQQIMWLNG